MKRDDDQWPVGDDRRRSDHEQHRRRIDGARQDRFVRQRPNEVAAALCKCIGARRTVVVHENRLGNRLPNRTGYIDEGLVEAECMREAASELFLKCQRHCESLAFVMEVGDEVKLMMACGSGDE